MEVKTTVNANKERKGLEEALTLAKSAKTIVVVKGKKVVTFDMAKDKPDDDTLAKHLLGPTGNLRAPTALVDKTLLVGFNEETYRQYLS